MPREDADLFAEIGARLAICRGEIGVSQAAMAEAIGVSHRAYHSYEKGKRGVPVEALVKMQDKFEVDVAWLLLGTKSIRVGHDFEALKRIETSLDQYLVSAGIKIKSEKRGAIVARWYESEVKGNEVTDDAVHTWIEFSRE
ncbi:helix-turn-helix domain-containing protein [Pelagimonas varians]|uniref:Helix-turn-helix protein n=1 Tax=Pelagimonas varians TaxID=696760 RepID=A0A238L1U5_9RHOB|nr:helix-turn-helix transcriptional regulator [Pelagimonas varians]PYG26909.1 transcriptional regulator with XRE-family HTH domain [Pelagimonas varians]SMX48989.1 helix-turn-helix protein [Pelagimonas varians]